MRHFILSVGLAAVILVSGHAFAGTSNLVINGSFESPTVPASPGFLQTTSIPGWTGTAGIELQTNNVLGAGDVTPFGNQYAELNVQGPSTYSQTIPTTAGSHYTLSFALAARPGSGTNTVSVSFAGNPMKTYSVTDTGVVNFQTITQDVTAAGAQSVLAFAPVGTSPIPGQGDLIDNVSLASTPASASVPLPSAAMVGFPLLACLALLHLGLTSRKARRFRAR